MEWAYCRYESRGAEKTANSVDGGVIWLHRLRQYPPVETAKPAHTAPPAIISTIDPAHPLYLRSFNALLPPARVSIDEAAHGVIGSLLGLHVDSVRLLPDGTGETRYRYRRDQRWGAAIQACSGVLAQAWSWDGAAMIPYAVQIATHPLNGHDAALLSRLAGQIASEPPVMAADDVIERTVAMAVELFRHPSVWRAIERVAGELRRTRELTGAEIARLVDF